MMVKLFENASNTDIAVTLAPGWDIIKPTLKVLNLGQFGVVSQPGHWLKTYSLGSCIGVVLHDPNTDITGMVHVVLPQSKLDPIKATTLPGYFADTAIPALMGLMQQEGAYGPLEAKIAGGAQVNTHHKNFNVGQRNIKAVESVLNYLSIPITAQAVGGQVARTLTAENTGRVVLDSPKSISQAL